MIEIPPHVRALIFDFDGTLVDSNPLHEAAWDEVYQARGVKLDLPSLDAFGGMSTRVIVCEFNTRLGLSFDPDLVTLEKDEAAFRRMHLAQPIERVVAVAREFHGRIPMGIASGNTEKNVRMVLEANAWNELFPVVVSANSPVQPKPSPEIFLECARLLNVEPRLCHVLEDGDMGIVGAIAAGMSYTDVRKYL